MKHLLLGAAFAAAAMVGTANAATVYAESIVSVTPGDRPTTPRGVDYVGPNRYTATNILGAPNGAPNATQDDPFYSLGVGGSIVLDFGQTVTTPGSVVEVTFNRQDSGDNGFELFQIFAGATSALQDILLGSFDNGFGTEDGRNLTFTITANVGDFRYVRIVDTTGPQGIDGADIGSIGFTPSPVPVPAAGLLLGGALFGLGALRRRAKKTA